MQKLIKKTGLSLVLGIGVFLLVYVYWKVYPGNSDSAASGNIRLLILYCTAVLCCGAGLFLFYEPERPLLMSLYLLLLIFIPFYGILGSLATALYNTLRQKSKYEILSDDEEMLMPLDEWQTTDTNWEMIRGKKWIQSYFDIISGSNPVLKKLLLTKIMNENLLYGVGLLKIALQDNDYEIRSFAATVLNKLEDNLNRDILSAKREINRNPADLKVRLDLSRLYYTICYNGLADKSTQAYYLSIAESLLSELKQELAADAEEWLELFLLEAGIARLTGNTEQEAEINNLILTKYPNHSETLARNCALDFENADFIQLTQKCRQWFAAHTEPNPLGESIRTWLGEA